MSRVLHSEIVGFIDQGRGGDESAPEELVVGDINLRIFNNAPDMPLKNADEFCDTLLDFIKLKVGNFV